MPKTQAARVRAPRLQRRWLAAYWWAFGVSAALLLFAIVNGVLGRVELSNLMATALGTSALLVGALLATRLVRSGPSDMWFVKGTTTTRTISFGWLALAVAGVVGSVASVLLKVEFDILVPAGGFLNAIGAVSILAAVGPGYSEFREALASTQKDADPAPVEQIPVP